MSQFPKKQPKGEVLRPIPIFVSFKFIPTGEARIRVTRGRLAVYIGLGCELFGPFATGIKTSDRAWHNRLRLESLEGSRLRKKISPLIDQLKEAWNVLQAQELQQQRSFVTGQLIMQQAGLLPQPAAEGHQA